MLGTHARNDVAGDPLPGRDFAAPVRLNAEGGFLASSMKIRRKGGQIIVSQKTRLWFRAAACVWATVVLLTPFMIYSEFFTSTTTRFTCDRGTGLCAVDGRATDIPRVPDIVRAEMDHDFNRRDGPNWGVNLVTRDGRKHAIEDQRAIDDRVVADYRTAVRAINAYLADPAQKIFATSFTYRASLGEKFQSVFYLFFGVATLLIVYALWTKTSYVFASDKVTLVKQWPFQRTTEEIAANRIHGVVDRPAVDGRLLELKLEDASQVVIVHAGRANAPEVSALAMELAQFLAKPLESAST